MAATRTEAHASSATLSTADWFVRAAGALIGLVALGVIAMGISLVLDDLSTMGEMFDGLGTFFGLLVCGLGGVLAGSAVIAAWLVGRHPLAAALAVCGLGVLVAVYGGVTMTSVGGLVPVAIVFSGLLVGVLGLIVALSAGRVAITSPGGSTR